MLHALNQRGFTLVEVIMVIIILGVLAAVAMKTLDSSLETSRIEETRREMDQLTQAISGNPDLFGNGMRSDFGYVGDVGAMPPTLDALVIDPGYSTWKGPYIKSDYSNFADDYKRDAWGQLYAYSGGTTIRSTGGAPDTLVRVIAPTVANLTANSLSGQISDAAGNPPGDSAARIQIVLSYPIGAGGMRDTAATPNKSGNFSFANCIPVGNRTVRAVYLSTHDTVQSVVSVLPKSTAQVALRFPGALWAAAGGGGGSSGSIEFVPSSASVTGTYHQNLQFYIANSSASTIFVTSIKLTHDATAYYRQVIWNATTVFNNSVSRAGSGQTVTFSSPQSISGGGSTLRIRVNDFRVNPSGGAYVDIRGKQFTVDFSDGSSITFTAN